MIDHDFLEGNSKTIINKIIFLKCFGLTKIPRLELVFIHYFDITFKSSSKDICSLG